MSFLIWQQFLNSAFGDGGHWTPLDIGSGARSPVHEVFFLFCVSTSRKTIKVHLVLKCGIKLHFQFFLPFLKTGMTYFSVKKILC